MIQDIGKHIVLIVAFMVTQILLFSRLSIYNTAFCFIFISLLVTASPKNGKITNLLLAFLIGITIDIFNNSLGVHTFCCITVMFFRNGFYKFLSGKNDEEVMSSGLGMSEIGLYSFSILAFGSTILYSFLYFFTLAPKWVFFWDNLVQGLASAVFSIIMILLVNIIFFYNKKTI